MRKVNKMDGRRAKKWRGWGERGGDSRKESAQRPNSWTYNFVEVSGHKLERSQTWGFLIQCLHYRPVSNHFWPPGVGGGGNPLVEVTVNSKEEISSDFCLNYVKEFSLWTVCLTGQRMVENVWWKCKTNVWICWTKKIYRRSDWSGRLYTFYCRLTFNFICTLVQTFSKITSTPTKLFIVRSSWEGR